MYDIFPLEVVLTNSQKEVLESEPNVIIYGPAGSGKTFLTVLLAEKLKKLNPSAKIEIIVFTKALSKFIGEALKVRKIEGVLVSHSNSTQKKVDYIILDEFQDFNIDTILKFKKNVDVGMYLLGDLNQQIYSYFNNNKKLDEKNYSVLGFRVINLKETVRFSNNIFKFINDFFPLNSINNNVLINEIKPKIFQSENIEIQNSLVVELVKLNTDNGDIGILLEDNHLVSETVEYFKKNNIKLDGYKFKDDESLNFGKSKVNILTYHSAKGIEFDTIILPFFGSNYGKYGLDLYYSVFSRAKVNIYIIYLHNFPPFLKGINSKLYEGQLINIPYFEDLLVEIECYRSLYNRHKDNGFATSILMEKKIEITNKIKFDLINQDTNLSETDITSWINNEFSKIEKI